MAELCTMVICLDCPEQTLREPLVLQSCKQQVVILQGDITYTGHATKTYQLVLVSLKTQRQTLHITLMHYIIISMVLAAVGSDRQVAVFTNKSSIRVCFRTAPSAGWYVELHLTLTGGVLHTVNRHFRDSWAWNKIKENDVKLRSVKLSHLSQLSIYLN